MLHSREVSSACGTADAARFAILGRCLYGCDREVAAYVSLKTGDDNWPCRSIGVVRNQQLIGGVCYHSLIQAHDCTSLSVSFAGEGPGWLTKDVMRQIFGFPFVQIECDRIDAVVSEKNTRSLTVCRKMGFFGAGVLKRQFGAHDGILLSMMREDCRWL